MISRMTKLVQGTVEKLVMSTFKNMNINFVGKTQSLFGSKRDNKAITLEVIFLTGKSLQVTCSFRAVFSRKSK